MVYIPGLIKSELGSHVSKFTDSVNFLIGFETLNILIWLPGDDSENARHNSHSCCQRAR